MSTYTWGVAGLYGSRQGTATLQQTPQLGLYTHQWFYGVRHCVQNRVACREDEHMLGIRGRLWSEQPFQREARTPEEGPCDHCCGNTETYLWRLWGSLIFHRCGKGERRIPDQTQIKTCRERRILSYLVYKCACMEPLLVVWTSRTNGRGAATQDGTGCGVRKTQLQDTGSGDSCYSGIVLR